LWLIHKRSCRCLRLRVPIPICFSPEYISHSTRHIGEHKLLQVTKRNSRLAPQAARPGRYIQENAGVVFVPTEHEGNTYESEEEAEIITQIVGELAGQFFTEADKAERPLTRDDILVVTLYNLQVRKLTERLPGIRVGTVDKFQGQEAVVVIYSMCASSGDASPRGIEFLFSKNRLNVAISRAQTLAIVVGNRSLARTRCTTLGQMQLVNVFCRAVEHSTVI